MHVGHFDSDSACCSLLFACSFTRPLNIHHWYQQSFANRHKQFTAKKISHWKFTQCHSFFVFFPKQKQLPSKFVRTLWQIPSVNVQNMMWCDLTWLKNRNFEWDFENDSTEIQITFKRVMCACAKQRLHIHTAGALVNDWKYRISHTINIAHRERVRHCQPATATITKTTAMAVAAKAATAIHRSQAAPYNQRPNTKYNGNPSRATLKIECMYYDIGVYEHTPCVLYTTLAWRRIECEIERDTDTDSSQIRHTLSQCSLHISYMCIQTVQYTASEWQSEPERERECCVMHRVPSICF